MVDKILLSANAKDEIIKVLGWSTHHAWVNYVFTLTAWNNSRM